MHRFVDEVWGAGRVELVDELFAPDFVDHYAAPGGPPGREGIKYDVRRIRTAFPDFALTADHIICEGDLAALRWTGGGTHRGDLAGMAPSGKQVTMSGMHFFRICDGRIVERWVEFDSLGVMRQLGLMPSG